MVRPKNQDPIRNCSQSEMALENCHVCELVINRNGEKRPAIKCKDCKEKFCFQCANLDLTLCQMMRDAGKDFWVCGSCEAKNADLKSVFNSIQSIQTEMSTIKKGQEEQQEERERVLAGLKVVETVMKKVENLESVQANQEERLAAQELAKQKSDEKMEAGLKRLEAVEKRLDEGSIANKTNEGSLNIRLTNAVVREVREIEKRETNVMVWNIPESKEDSEEGRKNDDENRVKKVFRELKLENVAFSEVARMGSKGGRFPRKIRVILNSTDDCKRVLQKGESVQLADNVRLSRDKTFNERLEARLFWQEKDEENRSDVPSAVPSPRGGIRGGARGGGGRGRSRGRGVGGRGRGGGSARGGFRADSRKRRNSGENSQQPEVEEEENKRRRVEAGSKPQQQHLTQEVTSRASASPDPTSSATQSSSSSLVQLATAVTATPPQSHLQSVDGRPGTPHPRLVAREAEEQTNF